MEDYDYNGTDSLLYDDCYCDDCHRAKSTQTIVMILGIGLACSLLGIVTNSILFCSLVSYYRANGASPFLYLLLLAPFDVLVCASYLILVVMRSFAFHFELLQVLQLWWTCFSWAYMASHVSQSTACFLILAATIERFVVTNCVGAGGPSSFYRWRVYLCAGAVVLGLATKFTTVIEYRIVESSFNCTGLMAYELAAEHVQTHWIYGTFYMVYVRSLVNTFAPFTALAILNFCVVARLKKQQRTNVIGSTKKQKELIRNATRTMVVIVCTYLISNALNFFLKVWEHIDFNNLFDNYTNFYNFSTDLTNLLALAAAVLRLPICATFNPELRDVISSSCGLNVGRQTTSPDAADEETQQHQLLLRRTTMAPPGAHDKDNDCHEEDTMCLTVAVAAAQEHTNARRCDSLVIQQFCV